MENFNDKNISAIVSLAIERSRKRYLENIWYKVDEEVLTTNWIHKVNSNKKYLKKKKSKNTELNMRESLDMILED